MSLASCYAGDRKSLLYQGSRLSEQGFPEIGILHLLHILANWIVYYLVPNNLYQEE